MFAYAAFLRHEAGIPLDQPVDMPTLFAHFGMQSPPRVPLPNQQGLLLNPEIGLILINDTDPATRQRFTEAHELMELLFSTIPTDPLDPSRVGVFSHAIKERLCDEGAANLLIPPEYLAPILRKKPLTWNLARKIAARFDVSQTAAMVQLVRAAPGKHAVVLWRKMTKPSQQKNAIPPAQLSLFDDTPRKPKKRLRVAWALSDHRKLFIPRHKSIPETSSIYQAWETKQFTCDTEWLDLGKCAGTFRTENLPFIAEDEYRVLSLLQWQS